MFKLFKKRTFGDYISDTFSFFKVTGNHYFKNYLIINGALLLVLMVFFYFVFKVYFEFLFSSIGTNGSSTPIIEDYLNDNLFLVIGIVLFMLLIMFIISAISFSFPVIYMKLFEEKDGNDFTTKEIVMALKKNAKKIIIFFLVLLLLSLTVGLIIMGVMLVLVMIIIGIPLLFILFPTLILVVNISFYHYLNSDMGVFESFGKGFQFLKLKFWPAVGSTISMYFIIQIVSTIFTLIPYIFGMVSIFTNNNNPNNQETISTISIILIITLCLSVIVTFILNNLLLVNNGIIYYSIREDLENNTTKSDIDLIGIE